MHIDIRDWLNLGLRWFHVFAAIMWVGQTFFFTWLDRRFHTEKNVWMVHSGGFYIVDKQKVPELRDQTLHWFKWEAALTWLSGIALLILVYYTGGLMPGAKQIGISVAAIIIGWIVYDLMWISPLAKYDVAGAVISYLLLVAAIYGSSRVFESRASWLQIGAMLGTFMAANVWMRILPAQRQLIAATRAGQPADMTLAERAKNRSKHNTFIVLPVVLIMLSSHFPMASEGYDWRVLSVLVLVGWGVAGVIRRH
ncbi:MAG TPA: urate hydroxylase PuuD [Thermoanaerobaculia bacterium]|nr:urate hydroxylase PuuD [Thermoanaerobaculia bacterium]